MLNTTSPKISIIVPVYKVEKYLHRCIDSILSQSFTDFELILVDDGSPDNCGKICDEYEEKDSRIRVFHKENGGVSSARNLGLDNARGEWIAFIDSDDYVEKDYLSQLFFYAKQGNTDFVVILNTIKDHIDEDFVILQPNNYSQLFSCYRLHNYGSPWSKLYKSKIIKNNHLQFNVKIHFGEDMIFVFQYLLETRCVILIYSEKYIWDRSRPDSLTKRFNSCESEFVGKQEVDRLTNSLKTFFNLDGKAQKELEITQKNYAERTLESIKRIPTCFERVKKMSELDLTQYNRHKKGASWRESFLLFLLKNRCFYLYDFLMHLKH